MADSTWCVAMLNEATDARQRRGLMIAATEVIGRNEAGDYMVPSQSERTRRYRVVKGQEGFQCACPDFELTGRTCNNIVCVIHEVHESGALAMFPALATCTKTAEAAQQVIGLLGVIGRSLIVY